VLFGTGGEATDSVMLLLDLGLVGDDRFQDDITMII
jgi:hypothetical protein